MPQVIQFVVVQLYIRQNNPRPKYRTNAPKVVPQRDSYTDQASSGLTGALCLQGLWARTAPAASTMAKTLDKASALGTRFNPLQVRTASRTSTHQRSHNWMRKCPYPVAKTSSVLFQCLHLPCEGRCRYFRFLQTTCNHFRLIF